MMNASAVFRRFDMNRSGMMEYNEWMMAMSALGMWIVRLRILIFIGTEGARRNFPLKFDRFFFLLVTHLILTPFTSGYMMNPMDAPRLFAMIDRDRSGRISGKWSRIFSKPINFLDCSRKI
jgi:Ca2+-binding EF-hand superfamily protein